MSRSVKGTKKTNGFINQESDKYIDRSDLGFKKRGSSNNGTDSAHIMSWGLTNVFTTNTGGRPRSEKSKQELARDLNDESNLRIKTSYGNKTLDERRDARIAHAFVNDEAIQGKSTAARAYNAYKSSSQYTTLDSISERLGDMKIYNPETGRSHKVKHHHKYSS